MAKLISDVVKVKVHLRSARKIGERICLIETENFEDKIDILKKSLT